MSVLPEAGDLPGGGGQALQPADGGAPPLQPEEARRHAQHRLYVKPVDTHNTGAAAGFTFLQTRIYSLNFQECFLHLKLYFSRQTLKKEAKIADGPPH